MYAMARYNDRNAPAILTFFRGLGFSLFVGQFIGLVPILLDDIVRLVRWVAKLTGSPIISNDINGVSRLEFLQKSALAVGGLFFGTMTYGVAIGRFNFKKHLVDIKLKNWSSNIAGLKVVQISDLHLGSFTSTEPIEEAVQMINEEEPDIIFFTGDLVNTFAWEAEPFIEALSKLKAKYGKFSVLGNHDYADYGIDRSAPDYKEQWTNNLNQMLKIQKEMGFDLLMNENRVMDINGGKFNIVGVENWGAGGFAKYGQLDKALEGLDHELPTILLSHDPSHWNEQVRPNNNFIDIQLAGHTHGMQFGIELGSFKWSPVQWKYTQWAGLYQNDDHQIYVNRGLGHVGYPGRVGIMPEITVMNIS